MPEYIQCDNCGAVLLPEEEFCGEYGAPRPEAAASSTPGPAPVSAGTLRPRLSTERRWVAGSVVSAAFGVLTCVAGLAAFLAFGLTASDVATVEENWLYSALCCLLPIGGTGALLLAVGGTIWYTRIRKR